MDNREKNLWNWLDEVGKNVDDFYQNFDREMTKALDDFSSEIVKLTEECEEYVNEITNDITEEINQILEETDNFINELVDFMFDYESGRDPDNENRSSLDNISDWEQWYVDEPIPKTPDAQKYPACVGCSNYHGHSYGGNFLVCGMHPYGWDSDQCPDWEAKSD